MTWMGWNGSIVYSWKMDIFLYRIPKERGSVRKETHGDSAVSSTGLLLCSWNLKLRCWWCRCAVWTWNVDITSYWHSFKYSSYSQMAGERHSSSCYLDERTFRHCCQLFLQHSVTIQDGWSWEEIKVKWKHAVHDSVKFNEVQTNTTKDMKNASHRNMKPLFKDHDFILNGGNYGEKWLCYLFVISNISPLLVIRYWWL